MKFDFKNNFFVLVLTVSLSIISFIIFLTRLPPQIPLFYSVLEGEEQITDFYMILLLPLISVVLYFLNNFFQSKIFHENHVVKRIFYFTNLVIILLTTFIFFRILFLVV